MNQGDLLNHELENYANCLIVKSRIYFLKELKMDKLNKTYDDFFKQLIPESPLTEAFRKWNETTKIIKEKQDEHKRTSK